MIPGGLPVEEGPWSSTMLSRDGGRGLPGDPGFLKGMPPT